MQPRLLCAHQAEGFFASVSRHSLSSLANTCARCALNTDSASTNPVPTNRSNLGLNAELSPAAISAATAIRGEYLMYSRWNVDARTHMSKVPQYRQNVTANLSSPNSSRR